MENQSLIQQILIRYENGERHFKNLDIEGDFSHNDLSGICFEGCFILADFRYCNLSNSKFVNGNIKTSDFRYSDLTNSTFRNLAVESSQFKGAKTNGITLSDNYCYGQKMSQTDFEELFKK